jgi:lipopolysaccharide biosynthesis regulator YciM
MENQIVVIGQRMRAWRGAIAKVNGTMTCRTQKSSGDAAIDAIRCNAMLSCVGPLAPQMDAIMVSKAKRREKDKQATALTTTAVPCMEANHEKAVAALAAIRAGSE